MMRKKRRRLIEQSVGAHLGDGAVEGKFEAVNTNADSMEPRVLVNLLKSKHLLPAHCAMEIAVGTVALLASSEPISCCISGFTITAKTNYFAILKQFVDIVIHASGSELLFVSPYFSIVYFQARQFCSS